MPRPTSCRRWALAALFAVAACGSTGPGDGTGVAPALGRYSYEFQPTGPGAGLPPVTGTLVITSASVGAIDGVVYAPELQRQLELGARSQDAYVVVAEGGPLSEIGSLNNRIEVGTDGQTLSCEGRHIVALVGGGISTHPSPCTLEWLDGSTAPIVTADGSWSGENGTDDDGYTLTLQLDEEAGTVTGIAFLESYGEPVNTYTLDLTVVGTIDGDAVSLTFSAGPEYADFYFAGTISATRLVGTLSESGFQNEAITLDVQ
jgi:hypothetical protein